MRKRPALLEQTFRASANFDLVPFRRLGDDDKEVLGELTKDPEFFGLLEPRVPGLGVKSASRSTASLVRALSKPGALPRRVRTSPADDRGAHIEMEREITRFVLDGVLEVEFGGRFVSGAMASHLLPADAFAVAPDTSKKPDVELERAAEPLATLSLQALRYGDALALRDASQLSARLYFYNRHPITPAWAHRLPSRSAVLDYLNAAGGGEVSSLLDRHWNLRPADGPGAWITWKPRAHPDQREPRSRNAAMHKLYVSPTIAAMPDAFRVVVRELAATEPTMFKVGGDVAGLMRPDKMVLYFPSRQALERVAYALSLPLDDMPSHGVPFTSAITDGCLLSEGMDPPRSLKVLSWRDAESWRLWITNRLAVYMLAAHATQGKTMRMSATAFALARIRLDGVDTDRWTPHATLWNNVARAEH
ncbi:MAG: hypothetical protein ABJE47_20555 [bacterium]